MLLNVNRQSVALNSLNLFSRQPIANLHIKLQVAPTARLNRRHRQQPFLRQAERHLDRRVLRQLRAIQGKRGRLDGVAVDGDEVKFLVVLVHAHLNRLLVVDVGAEDALDAVGVVVGRDLLVLLDEVAHHVAVALHVEHLHAVAFRGGVVDGPP